MLFHSTPKTENDEDHRNDSEGVLQSAITPFARLLDFHNTVFEYRNPEPWLRTPEDVHIMELGMEVLPNRHSYFPTIF